MKHQYFGDQTDYIKHGFLRLLVQRKLPLAIHWMLTENDLSTDGSRTNYLTRTHQWRHLDPELFDAIHASLLAGKRDLNILIENNLIYGTKCCFDKWSDDDLSRGKSLNQFMSQIAPESIVFFDPDNGLEVPSVRFCSRGSHKYLFFSEVQEFWQRGFSVIVYQHFPRVNRTQYLSQRLKQLVDLLEAQEATAVVTSHVAFLCVLQETNRALAREAIRSAATHWAPHTYVLRLDSSGLLREN